MTTDPLALNPTGAPATATPAGVPRQFGPPSERPRIRTAALAVIEDRYADPALDLDVIAQAVHSSRRTVQRAFSDAGMTWRQALREARMRHAADLLRESRLTIREVAREVGYSQPAQFAKAFSSVFGVVPSAFRAATT